MLPGYAPTDEGIFVQLLLSGTEIIDKRHVNSGCWYALPLRRDVGVSRGKVGRKSKFLDILTQTQTPYRFQGSKSCFVIHAEGHVRENLPVIGCGGLWEVAGK